MTTVTVKASKEYPVYIKNRILAGAGEYLRSHCTAKKIMLVSDSRVAGLYAETVKKSIFDAGYSVSLFVFPEGEKSKNRNTLFDLLEFAANEGLDRNDAFVALGGGVTGDLSGLAASLYMRGVTYVQIPTTLLAAVDSSVGGKTAIDLDAGKNLCGSFWQPSCVICDPDALETLLPSVFADGMAEVIKYGVISSPEFFSKVKDAPDRSKIPEIIAECVKIKADIVANDEFDKGCRALLNLGHTFGHAIEKCSAFAVSHGSAVAIGLLMAARVSVKLGFCDPAVIFEIEECLKNNGLPTETEFNENELAKAALSDKKKSGNSISFVLISGIGHSFTHKVSTDDLEKIFAWGLGK
ncbi:MAG: 3-dehydroquinate synthase [Clostridia bacterium]|nr:3-dehydroquinate synthase [Clostridia bacterium]